MKPLADFACLSTKCDVKGRAQTYELPINATRCPVCGSKKIKRLFNRVNVRIGRAKHDDGDMRHTSSSMARRVDQIAEPAMLDAERRKRQMLAPGQRWRGDMGMVKTVPIGRLGGELQNIYAAGNQQAPGVALPPGKAVVGGETPEVITSHMQQGVPKNIVARDTQHKIVKRRDGRLGIDKA